MSMKKPIRTFERIRQLALVLNESYEDKVIENDIINGLAESINGLNKVLTAIKKIDYDNTDHKMEMIDIMEHLLHVRTEEDLKNDLEKLFGENWENGSYCEDQTKELVTDFYGKEPEGYHSTVGRYLYWDMLFIYWGDHVTHCPENERVTKEQYAENMIYVTKLSLGLIEEEDVFNVDRGTS